MSSSKESSTTSASIARDGNTREFGFTASSFERIRESGDTGHFGWTYDDIHLWDHLDENWWFIPWEKIIIVDSSPHTPHQFHSVVCCVLPIEKKIVPDTLKLTIAEVENMDSTVRGSGVVVALNKNELSIIGC